MGLLDAVFGDGSKELLKVLELLPHGNAKTRESDFRDLAHRFLLELGDIEVKREAGVQAKGTRIDLYAHYRSIDYLITIKKGLSEQKVKNIIGECSVLGGPALVHDEERERAHPRRLAVGFADRGLAQLAADATPTVSGTSTPFSMRASSSASSIANGPRGMRRQTRRGRFFPGCSRSSGKYSANETVARIVSVGFPVGRREAHREEAGEIPLRRRDREDLSRGRGVERPDEVGLERGHEVLTDVGRGGHQQ
jgi:hypothetical protein